MIASKRLPYLKINIPDTIVKNDNEPPYWIYTNENGNVVRMEHSNDSEIISKFKSTVDNPNEVITVFKAPHILGEAVDNNILKLLNLEELEKYLFSKHSSKFLKLHLIIYFLFLITLGTFALQKFIKCKGPKAFLCRTVFRRGKPSYVYILTNKVK
jgi:hypothetical protein